VADFYHDGGRRFIGQSGEILISFPGRENPTKAKSSAPEIRARSFAKPARETYSNPNS
jgi:hypothetical protein